MTVEELEKKRDFSLKAVLTLGISALPKGFWSVDTNIFRGTGLDQGGFGFVLKILSFLLLTIPFMLIMFVINIFKLIYYQLEMGRIKEGEKFDTSKILYCSQCGNKLKEGSNFCTKCGKIL